MSTPAPQFSPAWTVLPAGDGTVAMAHALQGRIFCELDGEIVHRYDAALASAPAPDAFNNLVQAVKNYQAQEATGPHGMGTGGKLKVN